MHLQQELQLVKRNLRKGKAEEGNRNKCKQIRRQRWVRNYSEDELFRENSFVLTPGLSLPLRLSQIW